MNECINKKLKSMLELLEDIQSNNPTELNDPPANYSQRRIKSKDEKKKLLKLAYALSLINRTPLGI